MAPLLVDDFRSIVLEDRPLIDVRAPIEFAQGAFPGAVNLPLMDDEERKAVGIRYKNNGNAAAVALGHELVSGIIKERRIEAWREFVHKYPEAYLYCFRGGQRSEIAQRWLMERDTAIPRLKGGCKAFRRYLVKEIERIADATKIVLLGGRTGSGKTRLLKRIPNSIDLEALAHHRGSSFGQHITPQPPQIGFENALGYALIRHEERHFDALILEHEGSRIGKLTIPRPLYKAMQHGKIVLLEVPLEERIAITRSEYVDTALQEYRDLYGEQGELYWLRSMQEAIKRIAKRLGSERAAHVLKSLEEAFARQQSSGELCYHEEWITTLLREYYDPMYDYQISTTTMPILFRGGVDVVEDFLKEYSGR